MNLVDLPREYCKEPISIGQNLWNSDDAGSGCSVLDINFPRLIKIAGVSFKNYYTAEIQIWLKYALKMKTEKQKEADTELVWVAAVPKMILMPYPHFENGGRDHFTVLLPSPYNVAFMRVVLKQPSFQWNKFFIYQISIIEDLPHNILAQGQFMDSKSKRQLEQIISLERQTKKCTNITKYGNESADERSSRMMDDFSYELSLFPDGD